jgi:putative secretion ATPase (PEP-CTERM system associated)
MFESYYGLQAAPFQLSPDPDFFYASSGHSSALAYMKFGAYQGEGFIVVTGEIGAGKTTLVRTLLEGLDAERIVAAQIVSTQLDAGDLLRAICMAFGIPLTGTSKAQWLGTLEAFLTALCAAGRRALLVVDEAQNLGQREIEELRMLSNFQLGSHALLQSFLVGQPELRKMLQSKSLEQLRQRVIASCHLGPLALDEVRPYIEHRLRHAGWSGERPIFTDDAFEAIHDCTDGVPRRMNLLCTRALLSGFLHSRPLVEKADILRTSKELNAELGEVPVRLASSSSL